MSILHPGGLQIGNDVIIVGNVCITNIDHQYEDIDKSVLNQGIKVADAKIGNECFIGFGAVVRGNFPGQGE